jgi:hypothetical protein
MDAVGWLLQRRIDDDGRLCVEGGFAGPLLLLMDGLSGCGARSNCPAVGLKLFRGLLLLLPRGAKMGGDGWLVDWL